MADWEPDSVVDWQVRKANRRIQMKFPGSEVSLTKAEIIKAREDAYSFLEQQRGPNSDGLNLLKESSIQYFPPQAKGMFSVEVGNSLTAFGDVKAMKPEFVKDYRASKDPVKVEVTVGRHLEMRNQRLGVPYERTLPA
ncbi:hypothetical protein [Pseudorhizobium flavum]|uniref:hypothetical protein n=1 Tax=Pseudorhizobium flavum TaxID=1335061 RepID=UPI00376F7BF4